MPQAHADPEEIRKFARMLKVFNQDLMNNTRVLQGQFQNLEETWKDRQFQEFAQEFERLIHILHQFVQSSEQQIPLLQKKAEQLDKYLSGSPANASAASLTSIKSTPSSKTETSSHTHAPKRAALLLEWFFLKSALDGYYTGGWSWVGWSTRNRGRASSGTMGEAFSRDILHEIYGLQQVDFDQPYQGFDNLMRSPTLGYIIVESKVDRSGKFHPAQTKNGPQGSPAWIEKQVERMMNPQTKAYSERNALIAQHIRETGAEHVPVVSTVIHPETGDVNIYYRAPGQHDWQLLPASESLLVALESNHQRSQLPEHKADQPHQDIWTRARECTSKIATAVGITLLVFANRVTAPAQDIYDNLRLDLLLDPPVVIHEGETSEQACDPAQPAAQAAHQSHIDTAVGNLAGLQENEHEQRRRKAREYHQLEKQASRTDDS
jgi:uncharacterized protein YukE